MLRPLKVTIANWPAGQVEMIEAANNPERPELGTRQVPMGGELWIEQDDFMEDPPKEFFRLGPGREVRLRYADVMRSLPPLLELAASRAITEGTPGRAVTLRALIKDLSVPASN